MRGKRNVNLTTQKKQHKFNYKINDQMDILRVPKREQEQRQQSLNQPI